VLAHALAEPPRDAAPLAWHAQDMGTPAVDLDDKDAVWAALDRA
jgi:hypothetical protein